MKKGVLGLMTGRMRSLLMSETRLLCVRNGFSHSERERLESNGSTILQSVMLEAP